MIMNIWEKYVNNLDLPLHPGLYWTTGPSPRFESWMGAKTKRPFNKGILIFV
jgi:hypothetical protein